VENCSLQEVFLENGRVSGVMTSEGKVKKSKEKIVSPFLMRFLI